LYEVSHGNASLVLTTSNTTAVLNLKKNGYVNIIAEVVHGKSALKEVVYDPIEVVVEKSAKGPNKTIVIAACVLIMMLLVAVTFFFVKYKLVKKEINRIENIGMGITVMDDSIVGQRTGGNKT
jgi:hypothetical protein